MIDEPMPDKPMYDEWLASRRIAEVPDDLTDRVIAAVEKRVVQQIIMFALRMVLTNRNLPA